MEVVDLIDPHFGLELWLPPKTGAIGRNPYRRIETGQLELAIFADQFDSWLIVGIFAKIVFRQKFEADPPRSRHFVFALEHHPLAAGADAILFVLVRAHGAALGK